MTDLIKTLENKKEVVSRLEGLQWALGRGEAQSFYTQLDRQPYTGQFQAGYEEVIRLVRVYSEAMPDDKYWHLVATSLEDFISMAQDDDQWHVAKGAYACVDMLTSDKAWAQLTTWIALIRPNTSEAREKFFAMQEKEKEVQDA